MARFTVPLPSLIQGISQQSAQLRLQSQAEASENAYPSTTDGLIQRHPTEHVTQMDAGDLGDALVHVINRSEDEQYVVTFSGDGVRVFQTDGTEVPVYGPLSEGTPFAPDFSYLDVGSLPANRYLKAITLVDYTILLNRTVPALMQDAVTESDPSDQTAFMFVRAGNYTTTYTVNLQLVNETAAAFTTKTWDGIAIDPGILEQWELHILSSSNGTWSVTILGNTATYTTSGSETALQVATGLKAAIDALADIHATRPALSTVVTVIADEAGVNFVPTVTPPGGAVWSLNQTVVGAPDTTLSSIETHDIAVDLSNKINADARFTSDVVGSVVRIQAVQNSVPNEIWQLQITDAKGAGTDWIVDALADTATYTEVSGDKPHDIAVGLATQISTIPHLSAVASTNLHGPAYITVTDTTASEHFTPVLTLNPSVPPVPRFVLIAEANASMTSFQSVRADDSQGGTALLAVNRKVAAVDLLPLTCSDGFKIKIDGGTEATADDYYVQFVADNPGEFGTGSWIEAAGFAVAKYLDATTFPHALTRRQDDGSGTVTGTPDAKYFEWSTVDWTARASGDEDSAPHPSIANLVADEATAKPLSDIFFFRNRLGLMSGQNVVMSESGRFFNLFRTSVIILPDADPIDILVPFHTAINLNHATATARTLVLFSDRVNFVLDGKPVLTAKTVEVSPILEYENDPLADPLPTDHGIYFANRRGAFSGVREFQPSTTVVDQFVVDNVSVSVPQYVDGNVIQFANLELEGLLLTLAAGDQSKLYALKTFSSGPDRLQTAWQRFGFGQNARVLGLGFIGTVLYLVVNRPDGTHLESVTILSNLVDEGALYVTRLDRRVGFDTGTFGAGSTSWTLPYEPDADETYVAVTKSPNLNDGGTVLPLTVSGSTVTTPGDYSAVPVWIGQTYETRYRFSKLYLKQSQSQNSPQTLRTGGRIQTLHGMVAYNNTADFYVEVTPRGRTARQAHLDLARAAEVLDGNLPLGKGVFRFPVLARDATVDLVTSSPLPVSWQSAEFEVDATYPYFQKWQGQG